MGTRKTSYKFFWNFEKEEAWLEQMSAQGWHLVKVANQAYTFEQGEPEERLYRIDFRKLDRADDIQDYVTLFADSGWKCVKPGKYAYNYYFYAAKDSGAQDIFSDRASKAQRYLRYATYTAYLLTAIALPYLGLYATGSFRFSEWGYQTPGLWSMPPAEFAGHFLFETPFVLGRFTLGLLPVLITLFGVYFVWRFYQNYKKALAES